MALVYDSQDQVTIDIINNRYSVITITMVIVYR